MLAVGLTGGIGSGKSTVADLLCARGAVLIDADKVAREVVTPTGPAYAPLIERFGSGIVAADGSIDRAALAAVAFGDPEELAALNAITHPAIGILMIERRNALEGTDAVVVLDIPLLRAVHRDVLTLALVVVVDCPVEVARQRLVSQRHFTEEDIAARMAAQPSRAERLEGADLVIDNSTDRPHLEAEVARVWAELQRRLAPPP